jgi:ABC-2 type transport system ATP-binding protein
MIQIQATKTYDGKQVLHIPSLTLDQGVYWLQGINGSGKTTLLRIMAGLIPFDGDICIGKVSLRRNPVEYRRLVSWADAEPLYPSFITGKELLTFYRHVRRAPLPQIGKIADLLGMQDYLAKPVGAYSSGMVKKLSLLLAFTGSPSLILLDEPLATLDEDTTSVLPVLIMEYLQTCNGSLIFSSHQTVRTGALTIDKKLAVRDRSVQIIE